MRLPSCSRIERSMRAGIVAAVPLLAGACNKGPTDGGVACTDILIYGIRGTARNASTNADITAGAYLVATDGTYKDSVSATGGVLLAAGERAGIYTVRIGHPGYFARIRNNVVVREDECHVIPVSVQENLLPSSGDPN